MCRPAGQRRKPTTPKPLDKMRKQSIFCKIIWAIFKGILIVVAFLVLAVVLVLALLGVMVVHSNLTSPPA